MHVIFVESIHANKDLFNLKAITHIDLYVSLLSHRFVKIEITKKYMHE